MNKQHIIWTIAIIIIIAVLVFWLWPGSEVAVAPTSDQDVVSETFEEATVETPDVAPTTNPLDNAAPAVNPFEKTNPFN